MRRRLAVVLVFAIALFVHVGVANAASTPSRPLSPKAVPGPAKVTVRWAAPSSNGGRAIDRYRVQRATASTGPWTTIAQPRASSRAYTSTGLKNGKRYYFRVAAHNAVGWSAPSARVSAVPRTVPSAPLNPSATPGAASVAVAWQAPASDGGAVIDRFVVQFRVTDTTTWSSGVATADGETLGLVVPGLSPGTSYDFRVVAHNVAGYGAAAGPVTATPFAEAPTVVGAQAASPTSVNVTFSHAIDPASVSGASGFVADNGLTFSAASVSGAVVTLTSSTQLPLVTYTVTAPTTVLDTSGTALDPAHASATFSGYSPPAAAFRFTDLDLRDPHIYIDLIGSRDVTDQAIGGYSVNGEIQDALTTDGDDDGFLDLSLLHVFRPLDQAAASTPLEAYFGASCTAPPTVSCAPGTQAAVPTTATNQAAGTCLEPLAGTTTAFYTPDVVNTVGPCFTTGSTTVTVDLGGIPVTLQDARMGATYVDDPATGETNGLLLGFISEDDADNTIIPANVALVGGQPLSSLLPGGTGNSASHSDLDTNGEVPGWWFYLNFVATETAWTE